MTGAGKHPHEHALHRHRGAAVFVFLFVGALAWLGVHEPGTWVHIKTGARIASEGALPRVDSFSYTVAGQPWTTESWAADALFYRLHEAFGPTGLALLKAAIAALAFALLLPLNHGHVLLAGSLLCVGAAACWPQLTELPAIFDLLFVSAFIRLLRGRAKFRWALASVALVELAWANLHGSTALIGIWLVALKVIKEAGRTDHKDLPKYAAVLGLTVLGWLANPLGWDLLPYLPNGAAAPQPWWPMGPGFSLHTAVAAGALVSCWVILQAEFFLSLTAASLTALALLFPALAGPAVLAGCPAIALALGHVLPRRDVRPAAVARWLIVPAAAACWHWFFVHVPFSGGEGYGAFEAGGAVHYVKGQGVTGRMFNDLAMGDYLISAGRPVFVDSRRDLYGAEFVRDAADWPARWRSLDSVYRFDLAVVRNRRAGYPARALDEDPAWRLAYADDGVLVYVKRTGANSWLVSGAPRRLAPPNSLWPDCMDGALKKPRQVPRLLEELDRWLVQAPDSVQALLWKAYALDRLGLSEKADRLLELASARPRLQGDAELSALYGFVLEARGQRGSAWTAYSRAVRFARRARDSRLEAVTLSRLASLHRGWGHAAAARDIEDRAKGLSGVPGR